METKVIIKEKAEAYDEVVNKLKGFMAQGVDPLITRANIQDFFPELKKSEDEQIREEIIDFLMLPHPQFVGKRDHKIWITWLEKQGEQKIDDDDKAILENWESIVKDNKEKWQLSDWFVEATLLLVQKIKQIGLSKSIVDNNKTMLNACINTLRNVGHSHLATWLEEQGEQKPLSVDFCDVLDDIKLGIDPSPKQDEQKPWSEEDEEILQDIIYNIGIEATKHLPSPLTNGKAAYQRDINWLKSLKDRVQPQTTWKPSEEMLKALDIAIRAGIQLGSWEEKALRELQKQLKAL